MKSTYPYSVSSQFSFFRRKKLVKKQLGKLFCANNPTWLDVSCSFFFLFWRNMLRWQKNCGIFMLIYDVINDSSPPCIISTLITPDIKRRCNFPPVVYNCNKAARARSSIIARDSIVLQLLKRSSWCKTTNCEIQLVSTLDDSVFEVFKCLLKSANSAPSSWNFISVVKSRRVFALKPIQTGVSFPFYSDRQSRHVKQQKVLWTEPGGQDASIIHACVCFNMHIIHWAWNSWEGALALFLVSYKESAELDWSYL